MTWIVKIENSLPQNLPYKVIDWISKIRETEAVHVEIYTLISFSKISWNWRGLVGRKARTKELYLNSSFKRFLNPVGILKTSVCVLFKEE